MPQGLADGLTRGEFIDLVRFLSELGKPGGLVVLSREEALERFAGDSPEGRARVIGQEPVGRMGTPEEIAAAVLWLCSDAAAFVIGHAMVIDSGQTV